MLKAHCSNDDSNGMCCATGYGMYYLFYQTLKGPPATNGWVFKFLPYIRTLSIPTNRTAHTVSRYW